jgi:predicted RNA-binding Zn-ribbon protein involved in translation (DUF1610 family)
MYKFLTYCLAAGNLFLAASCTEHDQPKQVQTETTAATEATIPADSTAASYTCPMHPEVVSKQPGKCPKCGMTLVKK